MSSKQQQRLLIIYQLSPWSEDFEALNTSMAYKPWDVQERCAQRCCASDRAIVMLALVHADALEDVQA
jgi:hypothetical protein